MSPPSRGPFDARQAYQVQQRAARLAERAAQAESLEAQRLRDTQNAVARAARDRQAVPYDTLVHCGAAFRVINRADAHPLLRTLRDLDGSPIYRVLKDVAAYPDSPDPTVHAVFLLSESPLAVDQLVLNSRIAGHPGLLILGVICMGDLIASQGIHCEASGADHMPALVVLGYTRAPVVCLTRNLDEAAGALVQHYLGGGLDCELLALYPFFCDLHLAGPARIRCLVSGGGNLLCAQPPEIRWHATGGNHRSRAVFPYNGRHLFLPPTHRLSQVLEAPFVGQGARGEQVIQGDWVAAVALGQPLLKPAAEIGQAYADFPTTLRAAFDALFPPLHPVGPRGRHGDCSSSEIIEESIDGTQVACRQIIRQLNHTEFVLLRAVQRMDTGAISLHLEHLTHPRSGRYRRTGLPEEDSTDMCIVKHGVLEAIATLSRRAGNAR